MEEQSKTEQTQKEKGIRISQFLVASLLLIAVLCAGVFLFLATTMSKKSNETISEVGSLYMTEMNERTNLQFQTIIDQYLSELNSITELYPPEGADSNADEILTSLGKARGFRDMAYYSADDTLQTVYGDQITVTDPSPFLKSLASGDRKVAVGSSSTESDLVCVGIPISYPMKGGENSIALVGTLPTNDIRDILALDQENSIIYSHVIRYDGSFVIRSMHLTESNYFDRLRSIFKDNDGSEEEASPYIEALGTAMVNNRSYSSVFTVAKRERWHIYCTHLPYSEWYLVTVMPFGALDEVINSFSREWIVLSLISCSLIILAFGLIFAIYIRMNRRQMRDLNDARRAAEEATLAKSEFLSNMSHDIRTPMNAIVGMTSIATANIDNKDQVQNCLKKITLSSKHLLGLINDVLDMSKIESGKMTLSVEQVSLREVMDSLVSIAQPQVKLKNQQFNVSIQNISVEDVYCDSVRLNQVLLNFISNAIKFTPEGGTINVFLYEEDSPKGEDYIRVHLRVKDTGIGMSKEYQKHIFDSFSREDSTRVHKTEGTGLGMAITKFIVDAMGGTIELESEQGKGSEFHVILDLERATVPESEMILPEWNMLVVDDDRQLCESAAETLKSIGINADWTLEGEEAVKLIEKRHRQHNDYHIVLLDWKLPGIDGIETARRIRNTAGGDIPILLISAYDWSEIEDEARAVGISGFISKPLFKSTLYHGLLSYTDKAPETDAVKENHADLSGRKILLAEDNDLNWEIANELLSAEGLVMERAENGQVCVEKFQNSAPGFYDAILMDIRMPVMTGYEAARAIRALPRADADLPIIAMTADAFAEDVKKALDSGMNAHISKPIDMRELFRILDRYIKAD